MDWASRRPPPRSRLTSPTSRSTCRLGGGPRGSGACSRVERTSALAPFPTSELGRLRRGISGVAEAVDQVSLQGLLDYAGAIGEADQSRAIGMQPSNEGASPALICRFRAPIG